MRAYHYSFKEKLLFPGTRYNRSKLSTHLKGKTVLITGATYGIGKAIVEELKGIDCTIIIVARTTKILEELSQQLKQAGTEVYFFTCDLSKDEEVDDLCKRLECLNKSIDVFINNAGKSIRRSIKQSVDRSKDFQLTMTLNYLTPVKLCLHLVKDQSRPKRIVTISSLSILLPAQPNWAAYHASKTAFDQWIKSSVDEFSNQSITTFTLYLPLVKTRMIEPTKHYNKYPAMSPKHIAHIVCKNLTSKRRKFRPWWFLPIKFGSLFYRKFEKPIQ